jgi:hypothetical protein
MASIRHRSPSLETDTLLPWSIGFHFKAWLVGCL